VIIIEGFSLDTLAKTRLLEQAKERGNCLIVTLLVIELKSMDLQSNNKADL
jgi:hypothetical protein